MRHRKKTVKLQRRKDHREALLKNLCKSLIEHRRIKTTLAKAKALRPVAEKLLTLGKKAITAKGNRIINELKSQRKYGAMDSSTVWRSTWNMQSSSTMIPTIARRNRQIP